MLYNFRYDVLRHDPNRGYESLEQDIKAVVDLYHDQCIAGVMPPGTINPRSDIAVKTFRKASCCGAYILKSPCTKIVENVILMMDIQGSRTLPLTIILILELAETDFDAWGRRSDYNQSHAIAARSEDTRNCHLRSLHLVPVSSIS